MQASLFQPAAFKIRSATVSPGFFDLIDDDDDKFWSDLSDREDRKLVYERLLTYGDEASLVHYLDGALLIDLWNEMEVPEPMRTR